MKKISKKFQLLEFKFQKNLWWDLFWVYKSAFHGSGLEFAELREYNFWDSIKTIDWKTSAKHWKMFVKKYEEERDLNVLFLIDISKKMDFWSKKNTKFEVLEELFFSLSFSAVKNNDSVWAFIFDENLKDFIEPKKWQENIFRILDSISKNKKNNSENSEVLNVFKKINTLNIRNNLIFVLTDQTEFKNEQLLKLAGLENEIVFINIFDNFELNLTKNNLIWNFSFLWDFLNIDFWNKNLVKKYKEKIAKKLDILEKKFRSNWIWYLKINTEENFYKALLKFFSLR